MYYDEISTKNVDFILNQTRRYLVPQVQEYGLEFMKFIRQSEIIMTAIQDYGINRTELARTLEPNIYILFDVNGPKKIGHYIDKMASRVHFSEMLSYIQDREYYITDYPFDSTKEGHRHVIVLRLPHPETFQKFLQGKYSEMYNSDQVNKFFLKYSEVEQDGKIVKRVNDNYAVLVKDNNYFSIFQDKVREEFGTIVENTGQEFDFPPYIPKEVLRYQNTILI